MSNPGGRVAHNFGQWEREEQLHAFYAWLPSVLHDAPGVDWAQLPPEVMRCCIRTIGTSPDAAYLAIAAASAYGSVSTNSLVQMLLHLHSLFTTLRKDCGMEQVFDLRSETIWNEFAAKTGTTMSRSRQLSWYSSVSTKHYPQYLHTLEARDASLMQQYQLPAMPDGFLRRVGNADKLNTSSLLRRQPVRDTLLPLFSLLRQLVLLRKELAERMFHAFRQAEQEISPATVFPVAFHYTDSFPELQQQGQTWGMRLREVPVCFSLWNKRAWILAHQDRYSRRVIREAEQVSGIYSPERDSSFVQFNGVAQDLFWFGDLIKNRLLQYFQRGLHNDPTYEERWKNARERGFPRGCTTQQPGLLRSDSRWFAEHTRDGDLLFEPEAMYRGILYAAALTTLAMTNGSSVGEILQVSVDGWISTPEGRKQLLLPDGAKSNDRRLFTISSEARQLLEEIERGLVEAYGEVPIIAPARQSPKSDRLRPARYLFQWQRRMVDGHDTPVLVRFLLHEVNLVTESGSPVFFSMDQIRYGGNFSTEERGQELLDVFGFNHTILQGSLSFSSLRLYCRDFYAYWQFAGSREAALQPETLARWIPHLRKLHYKTSTINRMVVVVQHIISAAGSPEKGYVDPSIADAFQTIKKTSARHHPASASLKKPRLRSLIKKGVLTMRERITAFAYEDNGEPDGTNATLTSPISQDGRPECSRTYLIPARHGRAVRLDQGQHLKIINTHGTQVCDMWAFYAHSLREFLSMEHVRPWLNRMTPGIGDPLVTNRRRPILTLLEDTSPGIHDTTIASCDIYRYHTLGVEGYHDNCADNLRMALKAIKQRTPEVPSPFNLWMNTPYKSDGTIDWLPTVSKAGDYIVFRAELDCLVVLSACPQDLVPVNGKDCIPNDLHFEVS